MIDDPAAAFNRSTKMKRYVRVALLLLVVASPVFYVMWSHHQERVKSDGWNLQFDPR